MSTIIDTVTIENFKVKFARNFKYLPVWISTVDYFIGDKVFYDVNSKFYIAKTNNVDSIPPSNLLDWTITNDNKLLYVSDAEIQSALDNAKCLFNTNLCFPSDCFTINTFLLLVAHELNNAINGAGMQADAGMYESSRKVGNVAQGFSIPPFMLEDSFWLYYRSSKYGIDYATLMRPLFSLASFGRVDTKTRI
jgi:hypothetical protein